MASFRIESRPDRSLLLTDTGGPPWGAAAAGLGAGGLLLAAAVTGQVTLLGTVFLLPLGLIAALAGLGALRHRDWILFDRRSREVTFRRGLGSIFRSVSAFPFDDVEAVVLEGPGPDGRLAVGLRRSGDWAWPVEERGDPSHVRRLADLIHQAGDWPVVEAGPPGPRRARGEPAGSRS